LISYIKKKHIFFHAKCSVYIAIDRLEKNNTALCTTQKSANVAMYQLASVHLAPKTKEDQRCMR